MFQNKNLLIIGGTGSFGQEFLKYTFKNNIQFGSITLFSRDELKHYNLQQEYPKENYHNLHFVIGDIRDKERLSEVLEGKELIINAAAMKHVYLCEQNPSECLKTNVGGTKNLIELLDDNKNTEQVVFISSDKAVNPTNVYGRSKKEAENLYLAANKNNANTKVSVIRYGNVYGASGSLVPTILEQKKSGVIQITDPRMERFFIQPDDAIESVYYLLQNQKGGEILVPKSDNYNILELAQSLAPDCEVKIIGMRQGEKLKEELMTLSELEGSQEVGNYYIISGNE